MNVLLLSPLPPPNGGIAQWTKTVISCCKDMDTVHLFHINTGNNTESIAKRSNYERFVYSAFRIFKIKREIDIILLKEKIQVAHITTSAGFGTIRDIILLRHLKRMGIKTVYHLHFGRIADIKKRKTREDKILKYALSLADNIIVIDPVTKNALNDFKNVFYIPNPIEELRFNYSIKKVVAFIGYVVREKGIEELLEAWNKIILKQSDWTLQIIGPYTELYIKYLMSEKKPCNVEFLGELSHKKAMDKLANSSIAVLPSYSEGFPYFICEAMFSGKAIVGTNVGAISSLLSDNSGIVCKPKDVLSLKNAIQFFIEDESTRNECAHNAAKKARKYISANVVLKQYISLWRSLL